MKILENVYLVGSGQIGLSHPFDCHIYLVDGVDELALIDSGAGVDVDLILSNIERDGLDPGRIKKIIITHYHADHSGGCKEIKDRTSARVYIHQHGAELVEKGEEEEMGLVVAKKSGFYSRGYTFKPFKVDYRIADDQTISVGRLKLAAIHTPGHSQDSTCFHIDDGSCRMLFSGDVILFEGRIGLLNLAGSSLEGYRKNFHKISPLACDALLPGHGVFVLKGGKQHIEKGFLALKKLSPPPNFI